MSKNESYHQGYPFLLKSKFISESIGVIHFINLFFLLIFVKDAYNSSIYFDYVLMSSVNMLDRKLHQVTKNRSFCVVLPVCSLIIMELILIM